MVARTFLLSFHKFAPVAAMFALVAVIVLSRLLSSHLVSIYHACRLKEDGTFVLMLTLGHLTDEIDHSCPPVLHIVRGVNTRTFLSHSLTSTFFSTDSHNYLDLLFHLTAILSSHTYEDGSLNEGQFHEYCFDCFQLSPSLFICQCFYFI